MSETIEELETEVIYCYCCEDFTPHEVFDGQDGKIYQCECGCEVDESEDEIIRKEDEDKAKSKGPRVR